MSIKRANAKRVFVLEVKGLPVRYYSGPAPTTMSSYMDSFNYISFTNKRAIVDVSQYSAQLDPAGGIAEYSPVTVSLAIDKKRGDSQDPHVIFERCGLRSTITKGKITADVLHTTTASFDLDVDTDFTSLSYPREFHLGAETIVAQSATSNSLLIVERGVGGTPIQTHVMQNEGISTPEVTTGITTFRGRRASLWVAIQHPDGTVGDYTELINGFIDSSPVGDGKTITLSILPIVALIDSNVLPRKLTTSLLHNYHYFEEGRGNVLEYSVCNIENMKLRSDIDTSANTVDFFSNAVDLARVFDISLRDANSERVYYHPRYASFFYQDEQVFADAYRDPHSLGLNQGFTYTDSIGEITTAIADIRTGTRREIKRFTIATDELVQWPLKLRDEANTHAPQSIYNLTGAWGSFSLVPRGDEHELLIKTNVDAEVGVALEFWTDTDTFLTTVTGEYDPTVIPNRYWEGGGGYPEATLQDHERLWYGFDFQSTNDETYPEEPLLPEEFNRISRSLGRGGYSRYENPNQKNSVSSYRVRGSAKGYYQLFESSILINEALDLPTSATSNDYVLKVEYYDRAEGNTKEQSFLATHQTSVSYDGSIVGYRVHLKAVFRRENRSFGDWAGYSPSVLSLADRYTSLNASEVILRILQNGGGGEVNGDYDLGSVGLNLRADDIDLVSFEQFTNLNGISSFDGDVDNSVNLRDVIDPILKSMGACMVMKRDSTGKSKITLVPIGLEQTLGVKGSFTDASHIHASPAPLSLVYEDLVTSINFKFDYSDGDYRKEVLINNGEAIARFNEEQRQIGIELRGVRSDDIGETYQEFLNFFKPVFTRIFYLLSNPLRLWRFSVGTGPSIDCDLGAYYQITSEHLKGYGDQYGITTKIGMVRAINQRLMGEGSELELIHIDASVVGWHDSARVSSVIDLDTVEVDANVYSNYDQQGEATVDAQWFEVGDKVLYFPLADQANTTSLTIDSISGNQLTFTANHGITGGGGIITPDVASNATSTQLAQSCYMANSSTGLLNGSLSPQEFV